MIEWLNVLYQFLWILGLAVILTTLSLVHWLAQQSRQTMGQVLSQPAPRLAMAAGWGLIGLGAALLVEPWWHKIGWFGIVALTLWQGYAVWQMRSKRHGQD